MKNSGTSYTLGLVAASTGTKTATNYGRENVGEDGTSIPVFSNSIGGPFWTEEKREGLVLPARYLLTKTHCGGKCYNCPPKDYYIEDDRVFLRNCLEGRRVVRDASGRLEEIMGSYSQDLVARAVHLIRDPFDNVVSRFNHYRYSRFVRRNDTESMALYPKSNEGVSYLFLMIFSWRKRQLQSDRLHAVSCILSQLGQKALC